MNFTAGGWWIIDGTGFPKKGKHPVGVSVTLSEGVPRHDVLAVAAQALQQLGAHLRVVDRRHGLGMEHRGPDEHRAVATPPLIGAPA